VGFAKVGWRYIQHQWYTLRAIFPKAMSLRFAWFVSFLLGQVHSQLTFCEDKAEHSDVGQDPGVKEWSF
jgi:hypothetical protein